MASIVSKHESGALEYPATHLFGLLDDLLIYILNHLNIHTIIQLKTVSKYLNCFITTNHQCYHYFHMTTLELIFTKTSDEKTRQKIMDSFCSIRSLETMINLHRFIPMSQLQNNEKYKESKLLGDLPDSSFYEHFLTEFLSKLHKLEYLTVNGCFDDVASKLSVQPRLQSLIIRNTESSGLISTFFNRLLRSQFDIDTTFNPTDDTESDDNDNDDNDNNHSDRKDIDSWCRILEKGGHHTLNKLKVFNFHISIKTLFALSHFQNIRTLHIQYEHIDYVSHREVIESNEELTESLDLLKSKMKMICSKDDSTSSLSVIEPFIALLFHGILCLENVSLGGKEESITGQESITLLMLYYVLMFHAQNLHHLSLRISVEKTLKYHVDYDQMAIYHQIISTPFSFDVNNLRSLTIKMVTPPQSRNHGRNNEDNGDNDDESESKTNSGSTSDDIEDLIVKYGHRTAQSLYVVQLPLSLQMMVSVCGRFEDSLNDAVPRKLGKYRFNELYLAIDSADVLLGYEYGFTAAKAMQTLQPRNMCLSMAMTDMDRIESELFIRCLRSMAMWSAVFVKQSGNAEKMKMVESLEIKVSCFSTVSMESMSTFCVGDGTDMRMSDALQVLVKEIGIERVKVELETLVPRNDVDMLRFYMKIERQMKCIGFEISFEPNKNTKTLTLSYPK